MTESEFSKIYSAATVKTTEQALLEALQSLLRLQVKGHDLQDRLQFSDAGRDVLAKCRAAIERASQP